MNNLNFLLSVNLLLGGVIAGFGVLTRDPYALAIGLAMVFIGWLLLIVEYVLDEFAEIMGEVFPEPEPPYTFTINTKDGEYTL